MATLRHLAFRLLPLLMTMAVAEIALDAGQSATAVSARPCRVVNETQRKHFPPDNGEALAAAIASANPGDQLEIVGICTGTFTLNQNIVLTGVSTNQFPIPTLDGGQAGSTLTVESGVTATLTQLAITGGTGALDPVFPTNPRPGGGILNNGNLTLNACIVSGNRATRNGSGGGIYNIGSVILQDASMVSGNLADDDGGGIYGTGGSVTVVKESSTVSGNMSADFAGGIQNSGALTIDGSTVTGNRAGLVGGGIRNTGTAIVQNSSIVSDNTAGFDGGGIANFGTITVNSSTLSGNRGSASGGGIHNRSGLVILNSSTVSGNENGIGAGLYNETGTLTLNSSIVTGNRAVVAGGGIYNNEGAVTLNLTLVTENIPDNCVGVPGC